MSLMVTGGTGRLGRQFRPLFSRGLFPTHEELPIQSMLHVQNYVEENQVKTIIHCAALTNIPYCEKHREEAYRINVIGTKNLVEVLSDYEDTYFVFISTACVFPGEDTPERFSESDLPYPKNYYALSKLLAETEVNHAHQIDTLIIRTNFIERGPWPYIKAFTDRYATYLYSDQVAQVIVKTVKQRKTGLIHICGDEKRSMYDFAKLLDPKVEPITLEEYRGPNLTKNMALRSERIHPYKFRGDPQ